MDVRGIDYLLDELTEFGSDDLPFVALNPNRAVEHSLWEQLSIDEEPQRADG